MADRDAEVEPHVEVMARGDMAGEDWLLAERGDNRYYLVSAESLQERPAEVIREGWVGAVVMVGMDGDSPPPGTGIVTPGQPTAPVRHIHAVSDDVPPDQPRAAS